MASNLVFPTLPGISWDRAVRPTWNTRTQRSASGRELRTTAYSYPIREYSLSYEVLRADVAFAEIQTLIGFYNKMRGSFDSWRYDDPFDNAVTAEVFGTGNGSSKVFQITRSYGGAPEPVAEFKTAPSIYVNGVLNTANSIDSRGIITFTTAPANGATLTWTGGYWWRCRFLDDATEFNQFLYKLWECRTIEFCTVKP